MFQMGQKNLEEVYYDIFKKRPKSEKIRAYNALSKLMEYIDQDDWFVNILTQNHWATSLNIADGWLYLRILEKLQELDKNDKSKWDPNFHPPVQQTLFGCIFEIDNWAYSNESISENEKLLERYSDVFEYKVNNSNKDEDGYIILKKNLKMTNLGLSLGLEYDKSKKSAIIKKGYKFILEIGNVPISKSCNYLTTPNNRHLGYARIPYEISNYNPHMTLIAKIDNEYI